MKQDTHVFYNNRATAFLSFVGRRDRFLLLLLLMLSETQSHPLRHLDETVRTVVQTRGLPAIETLGAKRVRAHVEAVRHDPVVNSDAVLHLYLPELVHQGVSLVGGEVLDVVHGCFVSFDGGVLRGGGAERWSFLFCDTMVMSEDFFLPFWAGSVWRSGG
eukprot:CAMPEP_0113318206 /NCGR_PEP_ID=MMETSP0010_2-20120614/12850_1 /TAXON_ID=216773 ORGANISM="Corethron hystrix, Strain 308" /NCGR_SAMPLE_ID=MMETSP0010_2 /ASSEMBLY_ACC=CAM_ASM_000155 /LENGTH=159 /DNA_ID=CAMNT_0000175427 /DNA_START=74 /DNA_END=550 /DNA_ORIENTATION=+ /assembly_acc=CAM_ASM_000155